MNQGISLSELANQLERIESAKRDFIVPSTKMKMEGGRALRIDDGPVYNLGTLAHEQIGARLQIPRDYYKRMQDQAPDLLDANVNQWLHATPERRFVRTADGTVRAILSDRYKPRENYAVASVLLPALHKANNIQIMSSNLSERHMHIKVISHELTGEVKVGQILKGGISVRNSEVGCGAFDVSLFIYILSCMNGMIREHSMKAYHVGKRLEIGDNEEVGFYSREAIEADSKAFMLKVRDVLEFAFDRKKFDDELIAYRQAAENPTNTRQIAETIEEVTKRFTLTQTEGKDILSRFIQANDFSQWGLANAVTNLANDVDSYERSTDLEKIGGQIIDLHGSEWRHVARLTT